MKHNGPANLHQQRHLYVLPNVLKQQQIAHSQTVYNICESTSLLKNMSGLFIYLITHITTARFDLLYVKTVTWFPWNAPARTTISENKLIRPYLLMLDRHDTAKTGKKQYASAKKLSTSTKGQAVHNILTTKSTTSKANWLINSIDTCSISSSFQKSTFGVIYTEQSERHCYWHLQTTWIAQGSLDLRLNIDLLSNQIPWCFPLQNHE